jgi:hypothetical protein
LAWVSGKFRKRNAVYSQSGDNLPTKLKPSGPTETDAEHRWRFCLFAAAYLTHRDSPVPITVASDQRALWRPRNFELRDPAVGLRKAWRWLSKQLPTVAFMPKVEEIISQAATLSYRQRTSAEPVAYA